MITRSRAWILLRSSAAIASSRMRWKRSADAPSAAATTTHPASPTLLTVRTTTSVAAAEAPNAMTS